MANTDLSMSAQGLEDLKKEEAVIPGLYEDQVGYCTFGVGHLVHAGDKWGCFFLTAAQADDTLKKTTVEKKWPGKKYEKSYVRTTSKFDKTYEDLKAKALEAAKEAVAQKKFKKAYDKLEPGEKAKVDATASAAVDEQARLLGKTADDVLKEDLTKYEKAVREGITVALEQDEFDALVSFTFNVGVTAFNRSDLRTEINKNKYRSGDVKDRKAAIAAIEAAFAKHNTAKGVVVDALTKRRKNEADHFLKSARAQLAELEKATAAPAASPMILGQQPRSPVWPQIGRSPHFPKL
jgi:GH24 family phage-related lysozyme (muramidase)